MLQDISAISIWFLGVIVIGLVLLQGGAGDVGSAFGGGGQLDGALGVGANKKLAKLTGWLSFLFIVMIVILAIKPSGDFDVTPATGAAPVVVPPEEPTVSDDAALPVVGDDAEVEAETPATEAEEPTLADPPPPAAPEDGSGITFGDVEEDVEAEAEEDPADSEDAPAP